MKRIGDKAKAIRDDVRDAAREKERELRHAADRATVSLEEQTGRRIPRDWMRVALAVAIVVGVMLAALAVRALF